MSSPWSLTHPVREVLRARRTSGSKPGHRDDGWKVGVAVEGGGLRGVVSAAMLTALEDLGYADAFDDVYACSSGAVNGAYFINRQTWFPLSIYFDDLTTGEFLDFRRLLRWQGPMNLDYVFEEVLVRRKPLDYAAIIACRQRLHITITDVDALEPLDVSDFESPDDLRSALQASAWLPLAIRGTATFRGGRAIDGGVLRFHPFRAAIADGCTHVLSLSTRPIGPQPRKVPATNKLVARHLEKLRPGLGTGFLASARRPSSNRRRAWSTPTDRGCRGCRHTDRRRGPGQGRPDRRGLDHRARRAPGHGRPRGLHRGGTCRPALAGDPRRTETRRAPPAAPDEPGRQQETGPDAWPPVFRAESQPDQSDRSRPDAVDRTHY
jgi:predicted patatin/cPLA2 family phospholipase